MSERFLEFKGGPSRLVGKQKKWEPRVTINSRGVMGLNIMAIDNLADAEAVTLFFDVHRQIIGLKPSGPGRSNAFLLKRKKEQLYWTVNARSFCLHFDIKVGRTISFNNIESDETGMIKLDLTNTTFVGREPKAVSSSQQDAIMV
ncbi:MAG TPA: hypothetical protein VK612_03535 [Pyrinomonadaceae bacterium]|nr:hypothetical protein [Pyrinomonadaceae bacterium]